MEAVGRGLAEPRIVCVFNGRVSACVSVTPRTSAQTGEDTGEVKPNPQHRVCAAVSTTSTAVLAHRSSYYVFMWTDRLSSLLLCGLCDCGVGLCGGGRTRRLPGVRRDGVARSLPGLQETRSLPGLQETPGSRRAVRPRRVSRRRLGR